jgi:hypothetical protein
VRESVRQDESLLLSRPRPDGSDRPVAPVTDRTHEDGSAEGIDFTPICLEIRTVIRHRTSEQPSDSEVLAPFCSQARAAYLPYAVSSTRVRIGPTGESTPGPSNPEPAAVASWRQARRRCRSRTTPTAAPWARWSADPRVAPADYAESERGDPEARECCPRHRAPAWQDRLYHERPAERKRSRERTVVRSRRVRRNVLRVIALFLVAAKDVE